LIDWLIDWLPNKQHHIESLTSLWGPQISVWVTFCHEKTTVLPLNACISEQRVLQMFQGVATVPAAQQKHKFHNLYCSPYFTGMVTPAAGSSVVLQAAMRYAVSWLSGASPWILELYVSNMCTTQLVMYSF
jgi:hypothetical protein